MNIELNSSSKAELFTILFQHIKSFTDSINIMFTDEQMYVQCMDGARVSIMEIRLPASWFDSFQLETPVTIGISSMMLFKILNSREKSQRLCVELKSGDVDHIFLHMTSENKTEFDKHFEIPLMALDSDTMDIPEKDYQAEIILSSSNFSGIVNQLKMFGDTMVFHCSEEKIMLESTSKDQGKMFVEISIDDISSFAINEGEKLELSYSLTYLHNICLYNKLCKEVELKVADDFPMMVKYNFSEEEEEPAYLRFFLAPKINDDDE